MRLPSVFNQDQPSPLVLHERNGIYCISYTVDSIIIYICTLSYLKIPSVPSFTLQDQPSRVAVSELNGIPALLGQLNSEFPVIQQLVLRTLQSITLDKETRTTFRDEQGLEKILDFLNTKVWYPSQIQSSVFRGRAQDCYFYGFTTLVFEIIKC